MTVQTVNDLFVAKLTAEELRFGSGKMRFDDRHYEWYAWRREGVGAGGGRREGGEWRGGGGGERKRVRLTDRDKHG